ncbi:hypothetical protein GQ54DRAFT_302464 [Martensiomyces pterosporus]|nr:hypothetical protein GQ54DRAFT_302464 [Martensiomyces pterosporus]
MCAAITVTVTDGLGDGSILSPSMRSMVDFSGDKERASVTVIAYKNGVATSQTGEIKGDEYKKRVLDPVAELVRLPRQPDASSTDVWGADASIVVVDSGKVVWANAVQKSAAPGTFAEITPDAKKQFKRTVDVLLAAGMDAAASASAAAGGQ